MSGTGDALAKKAGADRDRGGRERLRQHRRQSCLCDAIEGGRDSFRLLLYRAHINSYMEQKKEA